MVSPDPFSGPDPARVDALAATIAEAFQSVTRPIMMGMIFDPTLCQSVMMAAIAKAHAGGLVGAIRVGAKSDLRQTIEHVATWMLVEATAP